MNLPSTLRHSKSHRTAQRQHVGKMRRFEVAIPAEGWAADVKKLVTLPPGTIVRSVTPLVVDIPMGSVMDVRHGIKVKALGVVRVHESHRERPHGTVPGDYSPWYLRDPGPALVRVVDL